MDRDELVATPRAVHDLEVSAPEAEPTREQVDEGTVGRSVDRGRRQPGAQISSAVTGQDVRTRARHDPHLQDDPAHCIRKAICRSVCTRKLCRNMIPMKTTIGEKSIPPP